MHLACVWTRHYLRYSKENSMVKKFSFRGSQWSQPICFLSLKNFNFWSILNSPWPLSNHNFIPRKFPVWIWRINVYHMVNYMWHAHKSKEHMDFLYSRLIMKQKISYITRCLTEICNILKNHWNKRIEFFQSKKFISSGASWNSWVASYDITVKIKT